MLRRIKVSGKLTEGVTSKDGEHVRKSWNVRCRAENLVFSSQPVSSQDVILHIIGIIGTAGGTGCVIEFCSLSKFRGEWGCWRQRWIRPSGKHEHEWIWYSIMNRSCHLYKKQMFFPSLSFRRHEYEKGGSTSIIFWSWRWRRLREHVHGGMLFLRRKRSRRNWRCQMVRRGCRCATWRLKQVPGPKLRVNWRGKSKDQNIKGTKWASLFISQKTGQHSICMSLSCVSFVTFWNVNVEGWNGGTRWDHFQLPQRKV